MIHETEVVCGGDWMCMTEAELEGFDVQNIAGSALHACEGLDPVGAARQCCTWLMPFPWGETGDPNYGILSFDSFKWSILAIFQGVTLEGWAYLMYAVQDGYNYYASASFFFVV